MYCNKMCIQRVSYFVRGNKLIRLNTMLQFSTLQILDYKCMLVYV